MKKLVFLIFTTITLVACLKTKQTPPPARILGYLNITHVNGPDTVSVLDTINFQIRVSGGGSCYLLEGFEGQQTADKQYDIRAVGSYPNPIYGDTLSCTGNTYVKDTIIKFSPKAIGKQVFRFFSGADLSSIDTVLVRQ